MIKADGSKRPFTHPLFGSSLLNLLRLLKRNGGVSSEYIPQLIVALLSATGRFPISLLESVIYHNKLKKLQMPPPVFIIGHWRSGTTHICNLLSKSPEFGFVSPVATGIPHNLLIIGKLLRPWLERSIPSDRLIDKVRVTADSPQEDEFGMANIIHTSFLHGLYFPKNFIENFEKGTFPEACSKKEIEIWKEASQQYLKKVYLDQNRKRLLIRNPSYTTRVSILKELYPGARFIHIYRNPYRVFPSMKNYFQKLLPALALQDYSGVQVEEVVLSVYKRMMSKIIADLPTLPENEYIEISYEQLEQQPMIMIEKVYSRLGLDGLEIAKPLFAQYLKGISGYTKNQYHQNANEMALIREHWADVIDHYGY